MKLTESYINPDPPIEEMANLYTNDTGLIYPIWIGRVGGQHGPRIKVSNIPGKWRMNDNFVVSVSTNPTVLTPQTCNISNAELTKIFNWITINFDDIMTLWWMFEHSALEVKDEDTGLVFQYDDIIDGLKKI